MDFGLPRRDFTVSRGHTYSFVHIEAAEAKSTLLLLHGWPSHIDDWIYQIRHFQSQGYGLVVPDMLGYGGSSSPSETSEYRLKPLSQDIAELLDHVGVWQVVGVGHDWGATILSRFAIYHPDRLRAAVFLRIGPSGPGTPFDLDAINEMTKRATGTEMLGYISYIARDASSQGVMEQHARSVMDVMFADDPATWNANFHPLEGFKTFVEEGRSQKVGDWYPPELQRRHLATFGREGGYQGSAQYYKMLDQNMSVGDELELGQGVEIAVPSLLIVPDEPASSREMHIQMLRAWSPGLDVVTVKSGHWVHLETRDETHVAIDSFVQGLERGKTGVLAWNHGIPYPCHGTP
ncbi:epoxide hydrolase [Apiospora saccharicola]|uniref:Epoxide hydrolase n=1 Tax=Apiospora saccharicola TaxID=335842 RepID=A0ABR1W4B3_9PEZI